MRASPAVQTRRSLGTMSKRAAGELSAPASPGRSGDPDAALPDERRSSGASVWWARLETTASRRKRSSRRPVACFCSSFKAEASRAAVFRARTLLFGIWPRAAHPCRPGQTGHYLPTVCAIPIVPRGTHAGAQRMAALWGATRCSACPARPAGPSPEDLGRKARGGRSGGAPGTEGCPSHTLP